MKNPKLALLIGIFCISLFPVLVKATPVSGLSSAFYRMAIAFALLLPIVLFKKKLEKPNTRTAWIIVLCGICFGSDIAVWNIAIQKSTATQATLLTNLAPIWVGLGMFFFLPEKPNRNFWIGAFLALVGMVVLIGTETFYQFKFDIGFVFGILSGVFYAIYMLLSKYVLRQMSSLSFITYSMAVSSLFIGGICLVYKQPFFGFSTSVWGVLVVQGIVCQLIAWTLLSYVTQKMEANRVSLSLLSQVLVTSLIAWLFLGEIITLQMLIGGLIILIGIGITFYKTKES
ncbi:DMT family transporter [Flavobacterium sp. SM15]|uniref:DMT family transporter n=1 Tax=Flavobacterium sp. SM15 TaxID=2908005 RepID=UPI001EDB46DB|nr:DMT family transporter [Flavobacterium sp. SM15]MCG2610053.1 DMT family transporter [Flavobacterium sp. SM15]